MKLAQDLQIGDVLVGKLLDDKKPAQRVVEKVTPRTGLTRVVTHHKASPNNREIFEFVSSSVVKTSN